MTAAKTLGVGVVGLGWMGVAHARAWREAPLRFPETGISINLVACSDVDLARAESLRAAYGFGRATADWRDLLSDDSIDVVSITTPNYLHCEMVAAAAAAGKHIYCEKPVGRDADETARACAAALAAGVLSLVGYNYRRAPLVRHCRDLIDAGQLGAIEQCNSRFLSMYGADPLGVLSWRFSRAQAGAGATGDVLTHAADTAMFLAGPIRRVCAQTRTFIKRRPLPRADGSHFARGGAGDPDGEVDNDDYAGALVEYENGAVGALEGSRVARGPKCEMAFEIYGQKGSARWNFERMNELELYLPAAARCDGFTRVVAGTAHEGHARINPGDGVGIGYEDLKTLEVGEFLGDLARGSQRVTGLEMALQTARVAAAVLASAQSGGWETVGG